MGPTLVTVEIGDPLARNFREIDVIVNPGATLCSLPADILRDMGVKPERDDEAHLADGSTLKVDIGGASIRVEGITIHTDVIFGQPGSPALLGVVVLEAAALDVDPTSRQLVRRRGVDLF